MNRSNGRIKTKKSTQCVFFCLIETDAEHTASQHDRMQVMIVRNEKTLAVDFKEWCQTQRNDVELKTHRTAIIRDCKII